MRTNKEASFKSLLIKNIALSLALSALSYENVHAMEEEVPVTSTQSAFRYQQILLGNNDSSMVSFQDANQLDEILLNIPTSVDGMNGRFAINNRFAMKPCEVAVSKIKGNQYNLTPQELKGFLICVSAQLKIDHDPNTYLLPLIGQSTYNKLNENRNVSYNQTHRIFCGYGQDSQPSCTIRGVLLMEAYQNFKQLLQSHPWKLAEETLPYITLIQAIDHPEMGEAHKKSFHKLKQNLNNIKVTTLKANPDESTQKIVDLFDFLIQRLEKNALTILGNDDLEFSQFGQAMKKMNLKSTTGEPMNGKQIFESGLNQTLGGIYKNMNSLMEAPINQEKSKKILASLTESIAPGCVFDIFSTLDSFARKQRYEERKKKFAATGGLEEGYVPQNIDEYILKHNLSLSFDNDNKGWITFNSPSMGIENIEALFFQFMLGGGNPHKQGFKLHISATPESALPVLLAVKGYLDEEKVLYKIADSMETLEVLNHRHLSQRGKFLTVYPENDAQVVELAIRLDKILADLTPDHFVTIPNDRPLGISGGLFTRYGVLHGKNKFIFVLDEEGQKVEDKEEYGFLTIPDDRQGAWKPDFIQDIFASSFKEHEKQNSSKESKH